MELKKAKKRFIEIANKTGIHGENLKQEPNMQERDELWDITRVFLNRIYILDEIDNLSEEEVKEYNDLCYWSISALHWNDSLENYTFDNGRHRRDTLTLALCLYARVNRDYKVYENIKENFVIPHAFGSILLWVCNEITTVGRDIYFEKFDLEFIKLANEQKKAFFIEYGYYNREDKELEQDKIEKIALEIYTTLNQKGDKNLPQFLLKYIRNDKGLLAEDLEKNTKYLESILSSSTTTKSQVKVSEGEPTKSAIHKFGFLLCSFATTTDNKFSKEEMAKVVEILKSTGADEKIGLEIFDWFNEEMGKVNWKFDDKAFKKVLLDCIQDVGNFLNQFDEKVAMDKKKLFINDLISVANSDGKILDKEIAFIEMLCVVIEIEIPDIKDDNKERRWGQSTVEEEKWKAVKPTNPAVFGYVSPKIEPKICPYLKTFSLINTECSVPPFDEWKLNEYIDMLLDSPSAKPLFWKNDDGIYLMFPTPGLLISADTDDEEEQNYLKFLASNVPNKHFDLGYTQSHKKEENSWYEKTYDILIANNFEPVDGKFDIGKVTVTTDKEIEIIAQVFLKRDGLEWSIEGEENNGEYIKYDSGISYQGEAKDGKIGKIPHGKGEMTVPDGPVITGKFKDGLADGHAKMDFLDGEVYEGDFIENKKHGKGVYVWPNGNKYEGEYQKGEQHGDGIYTWSNGKSWQGEWENDKEDGNGVLNYTDGAIYEAYWLNGEIDGIEYEDGQRVYKYISSHKFIFEGVFTAENQRTTNGTITTPNGLEINLKDCEKYVDKDLTETYTAMKNTYKSHTFEYDDTANGMLPFERVSEIFGDCSNEEELSYEMDRVYGIKINNNLEGYVIVHADDDEIKEALKKERDIESNVIIKSDNRDFVETLVEILKLNNREENGDQIDILEFEKEFKEGSNQNKNEQDSEDVYYSKDKKELIGEDRDIVDDKKETIEENETSPKKEINEEFWWDQINDYVFDKIKQEDESIDEYLGHLQILFIDEDDVEDEVEDAMRHHNKVTLEDFDKLEQWIGKEEVKKWKMDWESLSEEDKKNTHETALYMSTEEGYEYLTYITIDKENFVDKFGNKFLKSEESPLEEETKDEIPVEETNNKQEVTKEDIDSIHSFRNFMKEQFPSLKLPKNKPYAGIDLKDGYSINFHVQKKAIVLSFRSVKSDPEDIMKLLNEKGLNGKDIGDGHILKAEPGKRNPSIITMNIEIPYSSEDEIASDALRENVRSYFEKFSELFDLNK